MSQPADHPARFTTQTHPSSNHLPMQIIHDFRILSHFSGNIHTGLAALKAQGIGGIVANMPFDDYMKNPETWQQFRHFLIACQEENMRVWLYDEKGYPTGFAGGQVLAVHPEYEAAGLYRNGTTGEMTEEPSYEGTHNCNNFFARARTINLLERDAVAEFIRVTHERYAEELGPTLAIVEAFFTDEPALNVLYLPPIPAAQNVPIIDAPDPNRNLNPGIPWSKILKTTFASRDLTGLFQDSSVVSGLRREFYTEVSQLLQENCFGQIRAWCQAHDKYSSGHLLWEEETAYHTPMYGNYLRCLMQLDIPGIDILSAEPLSGYQYNRRATALASSAAMLNGTRRIFTESSDFMEQMNDNRIASVPEVTASLAWQAAMGITDFTYYFNYGVCPELNESTFNFLPEDQQRLNRTPEEFLMINQSTSKLVEQLIPASLQADVFLYYPVELMQAAYHPVLRPWEPGAFPAELVRIAQSYEAALANLLDAGIMPCLIDGGMLRELRQSNSGNGRYTVLGAAANAVVFPESCQPPADCLPLVDCPIYPMTAALPRQLFENGKTRFYKDNSEVCLGMMRKEQKFLLILVNLTNQEQTCRISTHQGMFEKHLSPYQVMVEKS